ncbi:MAG: magnesium-dependent phosphatase-1 [Armatimonadetes bacterium]|nr:magnesium-dependent phosphatase-1 [Armatimonadota bacterium]
MAIRLVILDCDRTLWDHHNVTELRLPFTKVDRDALRDADGVEVRLLPGVRELLSALRGRGILISIASWNDPAPVLAILDQLSLSHFFTRPKVEPHPFKERAIAALLQELAAEGVALAPAEVLFVDDRDLHFPLVRLAVGPVRTVHFGREISELHQLLQIVTG